jgi:hypothetical protein
VWTSGVELLDELRVLLDGYAGQQFRRLTVSFTSSPPIQLRRPGADSE